MKANKKELQEFLNEHGSDISIEEFEDVLNQVDETLRTIESAPIEKKVAHIIDILKVLEYAINRKEIPASRRAMIDIFKVLRSIVEKQLGGELLNENEILSLGNERFEAFDRIVKTGKESSTKITNSRAFLAGTFIGQCFGYYGERFISHSITEQDQ